MRTTQVSGTPHALGLMPQPRVRVPQSEQLSEAAVRAMQAKAVARAESECFQSSQLPMSVCTSGRELRNHGPTVAASCLLAAHLLIPLSSAACFVVPPPPHSPSTQEFLDLLLHW